MSKTDPTYEELYKKVQELENELKIWKPDEESVIESTEDLRELFDNAPLGYQSLDEKGCFIAVNQAWLNLLGYECGEIIGKPFFDILSPRYQAKAEKTFARFKETGAINDIEFEVVKINGSRLLVSVDGRIGYDKQGNFRQTHCILKDITQQRLAEEKLSAEKHNLENILEATLAGYWDWDIQNNEEYLSPGFKKMFGYEDHELPNSPETWQKLIFEEDLPGVFEIFNKHVESRGKVPYYNEVRYRHKNGSTVWVLCSGHVVEWDQDGTPLKMIGCHVDITPQKDAEESLRIAGEELEQRVNDRTTELRQSEARFRSFTNNAPDTILQVAPDGIIQFINRKSEEFNQIDVVGSSVYSWIPEDHVQAYKKIFSRVFETAETQVLEHLAFDGKTEPSWYSSHMGPIGERGSVTGTIIASRNITEQKLAEQALSNSEERLRLALSGGGLGYWDYYTKYRRMLFRPSMDWNARGFVR